MSKIEQLAQLGSKKKKKKIENIKKMGRLVMQNKKSILCGLILDVNIILLIYSKLKKNPTNQPKFSGSM